MSLRAISVGFNSAGLTHWPGCLASTSFLSAPPTKEIRFPGRWSILGIVVFKPSDYKEEEGELGIVF